MIFLEERLQREPLATREKPDTLLDASAAARQPRFVLVIANGYPVYAVDR